MSDTFRVPYHVSKDGRKFESNSLWFGMAASRVWHFGARQSCLQNWEPMVDDRIEIHCRWKLSSKVCLPCGNDGSHECGKNFLVGRKVSYISSDGHGGRSNLSRRSSFEAYMEQNSISCFNLYLRPMTYMQRYLTFKPPSECGHYNSLDWK